jgi:hypothetical protein
MFCCFPCLQIPQGTLNRESCHTNQGHLPPASSIAWLGCHGNWPGKSCLWTLPVPDDVGPLWHHNELFFDLSDCISTQIKAPPAPHTGQFGASNRQELLICRRLISYNFPPHLFKVLLRWHSSPVPYKYQSGSWILEDRKCFYLSVQKYLKPFAV